jgi:hypothetical protein
VDSLELGAQLETTSLILKGITFDSKDSALEIIFDELEHIIQDPQDIYVDFSDGYLHNVEVTTRDGAAQIIKFKDPPAITFVPE